MAKIYVSSTFIDLENYRAQVERVIRRMGHEDVAMEYYVAEDHCKVITELFKEIMKTKKKSIITTLLNQLNSLNHTRSKP